MGMNSLKLTLLDRRFGFAVIAVALLLATIVPAIVSASQLSERSIELSNSSISTTNVTYTVNYTSVDAAGAFIVDFCKNTPVVGQECTTPAGFDVGTPALVAGSTFTAIAALDSNTIRVTGPIGAEEEISVGISGIRNPSEAGPIYARIVTYDNPTNANAYVSNVPLGTGSVDDGGAAISITNTIGVAGAVLESMTFCVSGALIEKDCAIDPETPPTIKLGEETGDVVALSVDDVSSGDIYTQISTNAVNGAVVNLRSSAIGCGGLLRTGATTCDIVPTLNTDISAGQAKFGVKTSLATDSADSDATGQYLPATGTFYNNSTYALNYVEGDETGITSTFGDVFLDTRGAPANNKNMRLTFGASISNNTPAGLYSVDLGLIATGKY